MREPVVGEDKLHESPHAEERQPIQDISERGGSGSNGSMSRSHRSTLTDSGGSDRGLGIDPGKYFGELLGGWNGTNDEGYCVWKVGNSDVREQIP
jgi:hypothetical protein